MVYAYIQAQAPIFGVTGLMHVNGMQEEFSKLISKEMASANFNFIYLYRTPLNSPEYQATPEANNIRESARNSTENFPLGITIIDGINKSEDEIVEAVMKKIEEKIAIFKTLPESLKQLPDLSYTGQLRGTLTHLYGLFGSAKRAAYSTITNQLGYGTVPEKSSDETVLEPSTKRQRI